MVIPVNFMPWIIETCRVFWKKIFRIFLIPLVICAGNCYSHLVLDFQSPCVMALGEGPPKLFTPVPPKMMKPSPCNLLQVMAFFFYRHFSCFSLVLFNAQKPIMFDICYFFTKRLLIIFLYGIIKT